MAGNLVAGVGLRYNQSVIAPGAQTERRGDAGPVSSVVSAARSPAAFVPVHRVIHTPRPVAAPHESQSGRWSAVADTAGAGAGVCQSLTSPRCPSADAPAVASMVPSGENAT